MKRKAPQISQMPQIPFSPFLLCEIWSYSCKKKKGMQRPMQLLGQPWKSIVSWDPVIRRKPRENDKKGRRSNFTDKKPDFADKRSVQSVKSVVIFDFYLKL
jgi:hypothetical protein